MLYCLCYVLCTDECIYFVSSNKFNESDGLHNNKTEFKTIFQKTPNIYMQQRQQVAWLNSILFEWHIVVYWRCFISNVHLFVSFLFAVRPIAFSFLTFSIVEIQAQCITLHPIVINKTNTNVRACTLHMYHYLHLLDVYRFLGPIFFIFLFIVSLAHCARLQTKSCIVYPNEIKF